MHLWTLIILAAIAPLTGLIAWALWLGFCAWIYRTSGHQTSALKDAVVVAQVWRSGKPQIPRRRPTKRDSSEAA